MLLLAAPPFHEIMDSTWGRSTIIGPPIREIEEVRVTLLRHLIRNGNRFGMVKVRVMIWNRPHHYLPPSTLTHKQFPQNPIQSDRRKALQALWVKASSNTRGKLWQNKAGRCTVTDYVGVK